MDIPMKQYVKDENGKFHLVDKEKDTGTKKLETNNIKKELNLEDLAARVRILEEMLLGKGNE